MSRDAAAGTRGMSKKRIRELAMWRDGWAQGFDEGKRAGALQMRRRLWEIESNNFASFAVFAKFFPVKRASLAATPARGKGRRKG